MADEAPSLVRRAQTTVGQTAIAGGGVTTIEQVYAWGFKCWEAGHIVSPDQSTLSAFAFGTILLGHALKRIRFGKQHTRVTDTPAAA